MLSNNISVAVLIVLSLFILLMASIKNIDSEYLIMTTNGLLEKTDQTKLMIKYPHLQQLYSYDEGVEKCILSRPEKFKDEQLKQLFQTKKYLHCTLSKRAFF